MKWIEILQREDDCLSLPRISALVCLVVTIALMITEAFGHEVKHLPEFMLFTGGLFGYCGGSRYFDQKKPPIEKRGVSL